MEDVAVQRFEIVPKKNGKYARRSNGTLAIPNGTRFNLTCQIISSDLPPAKDISRSGSASWERDDRSLGKLKRRTDAKLRRQEGERTMVSLREASGSERDDRWASTGLSDTGALSAWNDVMSSSVAEMCIDTNHRANFRAQWVRFGLGPIDINNFRTAEQTISRSQAMARRCSEEVFALSYMQQGTAALRHAGIDLHVPEGSFCMVSHASPYSFQFPRGAIALTAHMPSSWLRRWVPQPEAMLARTFDASLWGGALAAMLSAIDQNGLEDAALSRSCIADQLGAFLALMNGNVTTGETLHQGKLFQRAIQIMRDRFDDLELSPATLASELNISKRYVHKIFAGNDTTFGAALLELRLCRAAEMLTDPRYGIYRVADVAYACGFSDSSHFARRFRDRFGAAPLQLRKGH
ncbi:AraC-like DNA-binding protein [Sphingobium sp. B2D3A]|uniref:helix-turn-helix domain-containing protein n=1 Tax=unclassified Sphingobium TaxID=2611147 RepID=UPI002223F9D6|nr:MULTISPECIES: AraC family transcriptional regulator [unclassified Sphingobium]MCW2338883.1 AraC-like DNA-binding protein [Sphingobium sp. B2D3A]MCW2385308.1 AraC-like DNA-binding protein [Sphingobium sp. B2D3D]